MRPMQIMGDALAALTAQLRAPKLVTIHMQRDCVGRVVYRACVNGWMMPQVHSRELAVIAAIHMRG